MRMRMRDSENRREEKRRECLTRYRMRMRMRDSENRREEKRREEKRMSNKIQNENERQ